MTTHTVIFGGGSQSLVTIAYNDQGEPVVPTSPTYHVVDLRVSDESTDRDVVAAATAATVDSVSTTTTAAAGPSESDPRQIALASAVGVTEGTRYLLEQNGRRELVLVDRIDGTTIHARDRLRFAFTSGASFLGVEVTATFPSSEADDEAEYDDGGGPYAIDWTFTGAADKRELVWIRRQPEPLHGSIEGIRRRDQLVGRQTENHASLETALAAANEDLAADLRNVGIDPTMLEARTLDLMVEYRAAYLMRCEYASGREDLDQQLRIATKHQDRYMHLLQALTVGEPPEGTVRTDEDDQAEAGTTSVHTHWFKVN